MHGICRISKTIEHSIAEAPVLCVWVCAHDKYQQHLFLSLPPADNNSPHIALCVLLLYVIPTVAQRLLRLRLPWRDVQLPRREAAGREGLFPAAKRFHAPLVGRRALHIRRAPLAPVHQWSSQTEAGDCSVPECSAAVSGGAAGADDGRDYLQLQIRTGGLAVWAQRPTHVLVLRPGSRLEYGKCPTTVYTW